LKSNAWKSYVIFTALTEAVGLLAGFLTQDGLENYGSILKSALTPPAFVFPLAWTILFALMGIGAARVWRAPPSRARTGGIRLFALQLAVNFFWSLIFFRWQAFGGSFLWLVFLWVLIWGMILSFAKADLKAALLQIPYLLWVTFAGYLNYAVWMLNP
jgi:benzodiazapine receptor